MPIDESGAQLISRRHRHRYAADIHRGLHDRRYQPPMKSTRRTARVAHRIPAHIHQI
jgi:hypothetical protein